MVTMGIDVLEIYPGQMDEIEPGSFWLLAPPWNNETETTIAFGLLMPIQTQETEWAQLSLVDQDGLVG